MQRETGKVTRQWSETSLSDRIVVWAAGRLGQAEDRALSDIPYALRQEVGCTCCLG